MKVKGIVVFILMASFIVFSVGPAAGKSAYLCSEHHRKQYDAWNINPDGTLTFQATYSLQYARDPAGAAIWVDPTDPQNALLFITSEFSSGIEMVDPITLTYHGVSTGPSNLAGIDVDDLQNIVYSVRRRSDDLYIYDLDPLAKTLTERTKIDLPGCSGAYGIALDEITGILWVGDGWAGTARAYDVSTWTEDTSLSFQPSHNPIDIAVDRQRGIVYTVSMSYGAGGMPTPSNLLSKFDLATRTETMVDLGHQGVGIAVDEVKGFVYVTGAPPYDNLEVWNTSTTPWTQVQATGDVGNPAGIAIGNVSYNPLNLAKNDVVQGYGVYIGQTFTYEITSENTDTLFDRTGVTMVDDLPVELDFVSETVDGVPGTGIYDSAAHTVTWDIGTIPAGQAGPLIDLVVRVNQNAVPETTIYNYCTIESDQTPPTTVEGKDPDNPVPGEPGTYVTPLVPVIIKEEAIDALEALLVADVNDDDLIDAIGYLHMSLGLDDDRAGMSGSEVVWGDPTHIDDCHGGYKGVDVFQYEEEACDKLDAYLENDENSGFGFEDEIEAVRQMLALADSMLAAVAIADAITEGGKPDDIADAQDLKAEGDAAKTAGGTEICDVALDKYEEAWEKAAKSWCEHLSKVPGVSTPKVFALAQNYPNPFNPVTQISYTLPRDGHVKLEIYNLLGQKVATLVDEYQPAGQKTVSWEAKDLASGIYFYKISSGDFSATKKMVLTK